MQPFSVAPVTLEGEHARLAPLTDEHAAALLEAGRDPDVWRYMNSPPPRTVEDLRTWMARALAAGQPQVPLVIIHRGSGRPAGSTRYFDIRVEHRALEIGHTWLGREFQRTPVNTECKLLLLRHAFETLGAYRVQFKTDARNGQSQRALERIGAVKEGVLRRHVVLWDGYVRDSVYYSVIDSDWPIVRGRLEGLLHRTASRT